MIKLDTVLLKDWERIGIGSLNYFNYMAGLMKGFFDMA